MPKKEKEIGMKILAGWWHALTNTINPEPQYTWYEECLIFIKIHRLELDIGMAISFVAMVALVIFLLKTRKKVKKVMKQYITEV